MSDDYCVLCGGPCRETELWNLASKKLGEQMARMLEEFDQKERETHDNPGS